MTEWGPKPKKAQLVTPIRFVGDNGKPEYRWDGTPDTGVRHVVKLDGPLEQVHHEIWLEDQQLVDATRFHRGRGEAEWFLMWERHLGLDTIAANRLLIASGYLPSQHALVDGCLCVACSLTW